MGTQRDTCFLYFPKGILTNKTFYLMSRNILQSIGLAHSLKVSQRATTFLLVGNFKRLEDAVDQILNDYFW